MYPTTLFGLVLFCAALLYAARPERRGLRVTRGLAVLTLLSGTLGFVTGVIKTFSAVGDLPPPDVTKVAMIGVGESLNNVGLALCMVILSTIITTVGAARSGKNGKSELVDPGA